MTEGNVRINEPFVVHESIDGEVIVLNLETGVYYDLRDVGAEIWCAIQRRASLAEIVEALVRRYSGGRDAIERAVSEFIEQLRAEALVILDAVRAPAGSSLEGIAVSSAVGLPRLPFAFPRFDKFTDLQSILVR